MCGKTGVLQKIFMAAIFCLTPLIMWCTQNHATSATAAEKTTNASPDRLQAMGKKYRKLRSELVAADFNARQAPVIPPKDKRIRVIIDSDTRNEIDDIWAIALAILSPERFQIEGFVAANFDNQRGGPDGIEQSARMGVWHSHPDKCPQSVISHPGSG